MDEEDTDTYRIVVSTESIYFDRSNGEYFTYGDIVEFREMRPPQANLIRAMLEKRYPKLPNYLIWAERFNFGDVNKRERS